MASGDQDSRRKHRRSSSPDDDAEKSSSSKRHKHRHHHRHHRHRHSTKRREEEDEEEEEEEIKAAPEDDVEAPPPSLPVAVTPSGEDVKEGEICSDGGLDDGGLETNMESGGSVMQSWNLLLVDFQRLTSWLNVGLVLFIEGCYQMSRLLEVLGSSPSWLQWLRYSTFILLYPTGRSSEVGLTYLAMPHIKVLWQCWCWKARTTVNVS